MAARKATKRRAAKKSGRRSATKSARRSKPTIDRPLGQTLREIGQQYLIDGVKEVLKDLGVDVRTVAVKLTKPRRKAVRKPARRRR